MKVAHIINSKIYSGLENVACSIMEYFKENYKDVEMIYVTQDGPIVEVLKEKKLNYYIIEKMNIKNIKKFIKEYKPDILQAHDFTASVICALANTKIPIINHLHNNPPWIKKISINSVAYLYAGIKAKKILTVSESIENEYIFSKFIFNKIVVVDNPVSREPILSMVKKNNYNKKYDICCVGRLTEQKNPKKFIEIVKKLKDINKNIRAVWVGTGELYEDAIKYRNDLNLQKNISFLGFQKNPYKYMASSKIFMLTSDWEGYGLVAFEALTLGLPCVVSNVGGLPKIVNNKCGLLASDINEYIKEISNLLNSKDYYDAKANYAIKQSKTLENICKYMEKLNKIYGELK
jgi:glycosyltransferase involved in cell wall biosynthesis